MGVLSRRLKLMSEWHDCSIPAQAQLLIKKSQLKLNKFFMGKPSQNYGVSPMVSHNFTCSPT